MPENESQYDAGRETMARFRALVNLPATVISDMPVATVDRTKYRELLETPLFVTIPFYTGQDGVCMLPGEFGHDGKARFVLSAEYIFSD